MPSFQMTVGERDVVSCNSAFGADPPLCHCLRTALLSDGKEKDSANTTQHKLHTHVVSEKSCPTAKCPRQVRSEISFAKYDWILVFGRFHCKIMRTQRATNLTRLSFSAHFS